MTKLKVLFPTSPTVREIPDHTPEFTKFTEDFEVIFHPLTTAEAFIESLHNELNDISAIYITNSLFTMGYKFAEFIPHLPESLKIVSYPWVGADIFKPQELRAKGIRLANAGDGSGDDVADIALHLTLSCFRFTSYLEQQFRSTGDADQTRALFGSKEVDVRTQMPVPTPERCDRTKGVHIGGKHVVSPKGKVAGIVGLGAIGKAIAIRLNAIGLSVKYNKRTPLSPEAAAKLPFELDYVATLEELLPQVDVLVLAVPHTPQTIHLINSETIKLIKPGARIVNIGRGSAIDEDVLLKALDDNVITSFGSDVFQNEPKIDKRFLNRFDVTILPHMGPFTSDNFVANHIKVMANITGFLKGNVDLEELDLVN